MNTSFNSDAPLSITELVEGWLPYAGDLVVHDPEGAGECVIRAGELLVGDDSVDIATERLDRWIDHVERFDALRLSRFRLRATERERAVEIAADANSGFERIDPVSANYVHLGSPVVFGTPIVFGTGAEDISDGPAEPADELWDPPVTVAVLDTGLDPHPWFAGRRWFSEWGLSPEVLDADDDSGQDRQAGHGTFVTGVLLSDAPGVVIRHQRVLSSLGISDDLTVVAGLRSLRRAATARGEHLDVVLLTSGCHTADNRCPPALAWEISRFDNAVVVASAGNHGTERPFWPAALPEVLAVGATDVGGERAAFSAHGRWVDTYAPGVDVPSAFVRLRSASDSVTGTEPRDYTFARWSGTSFAAPRVAAAVANAIRSGQDASAARRRVTTEFGDITR